MASFTRSIPTKNYYNWMSLLQVTIENVWDVFSDGKSVNHCTFVYHSS